MTDVFLCGAGLQSCLGNGLAASVKALMNGPVRPHSLALPDEQSRPYFLMEGSAGVTARGPDASSWQLRAIGAVCSVLDECWRPRSTEFDGRNVVLASSSLDRGGDRGGSGQRVALSDFAQQLALAQGWSVKPSTVNTACTSAFNALQQARCQIAAGQFDEALVVGVETFNPYAFFGFEAMQLLAPESAEPLGTHRQGMVLGEAVAALRLTAEPSDADFANPLGVWKVLACANVVDGANPTGASEGALIEACQAALNESGLAAGDIDLIKLQAAGSPINDTLEWAALRSVFDVLPPCVSFKSVLGHTLGASCAAETALLMACLQHGVWPQLDYALEPEVAHAVVSCANPVDAAGVHAVLLVGLGFGGGHSVLILKRSPA